MDFTEFSVSDAGPNHKVMVYQRLTGRVVWVQPWYMPYFWALRHAKSLVKNKFFTTKQ